MNPIKTWLGWYIDAMLLLTHCNTTENEVEDTPPVNDSSYKIIGYIAGWRSNFQQQTIAAEELTHKAAFVKSKRLDGVMSWKFSQDTEGVLLNTLSTQLFTPHEM